MRILIDATAVGEGRGGIVTYLKGLLKGWEDAGFRDELVIAGTDKLPADLDEIVRGRGAIHRFRDNRFVTQHVRIPALARRCRPDVVLATTPIVPLLIGGRPVVAMVHDLRHLHRPGEFGRVQRWYRSAFYRSAAWRCRALLSNSNATTRDVIATYPAAAAKITTVYLGCDHVPLAEHAPKGSHALAHAHWNNKQPDVAIHAWSILKATHPDFTNQLHLVGIPTEGRADLQHLITARGLDGLVILHDYLDDGTYQNLFSTARLLLMPSTFEGFGLPIIEAMRVGVGVVASDGAGMHEAGGTYALYAPSTDPGAFAEQIARVLFDDELHCSLVSAGRRHAGTFTWRRTAEQTRAILASAAVRHYPGGPS